MSSISLVSVPAAAPVSRNRLLLTSGLGWMFDGRGQFHRHGRGRGGVRADG